MQLRDRALAGPSTSGLSAARMNPPGRTFGAPEGELRAIRVWHRLPAFCFAVCGLHGYSIFTRPSRSAFEMTLTEDSAIAAAPMTGESRMPKAG